MNLAVDIMRSASALTEGNEERYQDSIKRAYHTLDLLRAEGRAEASEEGFLMLRALALAREDATLPSLRRALDSILLGSR
ncbi:MAG: hypothetical protein Q7R54_02025 [bacterium]|nr:hypothetical protein [bacterium]